MPELFGRGSIRTELERRGGHLSQFGGVQLPVFDNGPSRRIRYIQFHNGTGFNFEAAVDREIDAFHVRIEGGAGNRKTKT